MNFPILSAIIFVPIIGVIFILITTGTERNIEKNSKYVAIFSSLVNFILTILLWFSFDSSKAAFQFIEERTWIDGFVNYKKSKLI